MLVPIAWQQIMDEIERRASKMHGDSEFTVTVSADDLKAIDSTPPVPEPKFKVKNFSVATSQGHGERFHNIQVNVEGLSDYACYNEKEIRSAVDYLNKQLK